jgi:hypothetical protein
MRVMMTDGGRRFRLETLPGGRKALVRRDESAETYIIGAESGTAPTHRGERVEVRMWDGETERVLFDGPLCEYIESR